MKLNKRIVYLVPALFALLAGAAVWFFGDSQFQQFYDQKMRASLFTGLFTLSGFLLSAKAFIILNLKKEMFATDAYLKRVQLQQTLAEGAAHLYRPLRNVGHVLILNVGLCLASSIFQFTFGLIPALWAVALCLGLASAAASMLAFSLYIIAKNLHDMYDYFEEEAKAKLASMKQENEP